MKTAAAAILIVSLAIGARADDWRRPAKVVDRLQLVAGNSVAILGAGGSYLIADVARAVGPSGRVVVVDSDPAMIRSFEQTIAAAGLANATAVLSQTAEPDIPQQFDLILLVNGYRYLEKRKVVFGKLKKKLGERGRLVVIDFYRRPMRVGPPLRERVASHRVLRELEQSGYRLAKRYNVLPYQYFLVFAPRA